MSTQKQKQIAEIIKCGKNPDYFFNKYVKIQHPEKGSIPFKTYDFQNDCVDAFQNHRFNIVLKSRQLGLSTIAAAYVAWLAVFHKDKNILVIATKLSVAQNFIKKVKFIIRSMPKWLLLPEISGNNKQTIEFSNGSVIKAVPTSDDAGRSEALSLLIVDEAAFIRNFDTLWTGLYPTLSTGGNAIILSTPNGVGGQYYDLWIGATNKTNVFNPIKLLWDVHPDRGDEWFETETRNMTQKQIAQELLCDFQSSGETFIRPEDIEYMLSWIKPPIEKWGPDNNVWVWKYSLKEKKYIISADVSRGDSKDFSTFHVIDTESSEIVCEYRGLTPPDQFALMLAEAGKRYNNALICPENNSYGYALIMKLVELDYKNMYYASEKDKYASLYGTVDIGKIGFQTNSKTRPQILTKLEEVLRTKQVKIYSERLYEELKTFVWIGNKAQARKGAHDDLVMALAIGVWLYDTSPQLSKQGFDVNKAMLNAFSVNSIKFQDTILDQENKNTTDVKDSSGKNVRVVKDPRISSKDDDEFNWVL